MLERLGFISSPSGKHDMGGVAEDRRCQGNTESIKLFNPGGGHQALPFVHCRCARKQRGRMAIRAHAQENQIKAWECASLELKGSAQRGFILVGSLLRLLLGGNTVNV